VTFEQDVAMPLAIQKMLQILQFIKISLKMKT